MHRDDLYRITGSKNLKAFFKQFLFNPNYRVLYFFRKSNNNLLFRIIYNLERKKYNIEIARTTKIGKGLFINHRGGVIINSKTIIGENVNIEPRVVIGQQNRGKRKGIPIIGDRVWLGANSVIVGKIIIGNNVLVAPNSYVNFDVPDNSVVIGNPGKVISDLEATKEYINRTV